MMHDSCFFDLRVLPEIVNYRGTVTRLKAEGRKKPEARTQPTSGRESRALTALGRPPSRRAL